MKKNIVLFMIVAALVAALGLAGCGKESKPKAAAPEQKASGSTALKLGHVYDEKHPLHQGTVKFSELMKQKTNGAVDVKVFPNSTLGSSRDLIEGLKIGTIDMALVPSTNVATFYGPLDIFYFPFIFRDKEHAYKVSDGPVGQRIFDDMRQKTGIRTLAMYESGFRQITNSKKPIRVPEDFKGIKMRVVDSGINLETFKALGANGAPMAISEVFTALQQGTVDGQDNPIGNVYAFGYYEVQKYITLTEHQWAGIMLLVSEKAWGKLTPELQKALQAAADESEAWERAEINKNESGYLETMKKSGLQVIDLTPAEKKQFQDKMKVVWNKYESKVGKDLIDAVVNTK